MESQRMERPATSNMISRQESAGQCVTEMDALLQMLKGRIMVDGTRFSIDENLL